MTMAQGYYIVSVDKTVHNRLTINPPLQAFERTNPRGARDHRYRGVLLYRSPIRKPPPDPLALLGPMVKDALVTTRKLAECFDVLGGDVRRALRKAGVAPVHVDGQQGNMYPLEAALPAMARVHLSARN